jgi:transposase
VLVGKHNDDPISQWVQRLRERCGWQKAVVALANKNARILWAVMTGHKRYDAQHVSLNPAATMPAAA